MATADRCTQVSSSFTLPGVIVMTNQALYTHHNGMWFDGMAWLTPNTQRWNVHSWTLDVWFKFYDSVSGTLIENNSTFPDQWSLWFYPPNNVTFQLNMNTVNTSFTFNPATDYNKWFIIQAGTNKLDKGSKICVKVNDEATKCIIAATYYATYYDDTGGAGNIRIGNGFRGYIRKIKIYDWFKTEPNLKIMYRKSPQCYKFHHFQPD